MKNKVLGIAFLLISAVVIFLAATGESVEEKDATPILITVPVAFYLLIKKPGEF